MYYCRFIYFLWIEETFYFHVYLNSYIRQIQQTSLKKSCFLLTNKAGGLPITRKSRKMYWVLHATFRVLIYIRVDKTSDPC